jgi:hypothetical protein
VIKEIDVSLSIIRVLFRAAAAAECPRDSSPLSANVWTLPSSMPSKIYDFYDGSKSVVNANANNAEVGDPRKFLATE